MTLATVYTVPIFPNTGILDLIFHKTYIILNVLGFFGSDGSSGFKITLAGLLVILVISFAAAAICERLAGEKPGKNLAAAVLITLLGAYIFAAYVTLPFTEVSIEGIHIIAALLGAIVFGVFYVLIRKQAAPKKA